MSRSATAWKRDEDEASVMISKEHFDSTIGFIRSDVADVKADVREIRSRILAQDDKIGAFQKELSDKFEAFRQDVNDRFDGFRQDINNRFDGFCQDINTRFDAFRQEIHSKLDTFRREFDGKLDKLEERFAAHEKKIDERFKQTDDRLARLGTDFAKMLGWQRAIGLFLALLLALMGGMFTAMAKGFHWF